MKILKESLTMKNRFMYHLAWLSGLVGLAAFLGACQQDEGLETLTADKEALPQQESYGGNHSGETALTYFMPAGAPVWVKTAEEIVGYSVTGPRAAIDNQFATHPFMSATPANPNQYDYGKYPIEISTSFAGGSDRVSIHMEHTAENQAHLENLSHSGDQEYVLLRPGIFLANYKAPTAWANNDGPFSESISEPTVIQNYDPRGGDITPNVKLEGFESIMNGYCAALVPIKYRRRVYHQWENYYYWEESNFPRPTYLLVVFTRTSITQLEVVNNVEGFDRYPSTLGTMALFPNPVYEDTEMYQVVKNGDPIPGSMKRTNIPRTTN